MIVSEDSPLPFDPARGSGPKRVLIVEDNSLDMALFGALLSSAGFEVIEAGDAPRGLDLARKRRPDLVIMDVRLPGMTGFEATRILKSEEATREIPVLLTSAYGPYIDNKKVEECGCDGYLPTPMETAAFIDLVNSYISPDAPKA